MKKHKQLGIWMDHSHAFLIEITDESIEEKSIISEFSHQQKDDNLNRSEKIMHSKEQHQQAGYYKKLGDAIKNYQEVILFGPTDAKNELLNLLRADHLFENIKIEVKHSDKMMEYQRYAFVREYFK